ncbi:MAG: hypothetical protein WC213_00035 [Arenimonas sp.]|jgi:hypothetical protein
MSEAIDGLQDTPEPAGLDAILSSAIETSGYGDDKPEVTATETPEATAARARDDKGRFAPKEPAETVAPVEDGSVKVEANPAETVAVEPPKVEPIQPPARWSDADKAEFAKLTPEGQQLFLNRYQAIEGDYTRKTQELAETRKGIEPLIQEVQKQNPLLQHLGMTANQFFEQSANVSRNLLSGTPEQRGQAIAYLVNHHRIPPEAVLQALGVPLPAVGENGQMAVDPTVLQLRQHVHGLEQSLQRIQEQSQLSERQRAEAEFNAIGQAKDESGQVKYPHFERVKQTMIQLAASDQAETWDQAYQKAVRLDDDLYRQTVESERQRVAELAEKARLEAVGKAKKVQPVVSSPSTKGGTQLKGIDAHLNAAMERAGLGT